VRPARKADKLTAICESIICKMWEPRCLTNLSTSKGRYRHSFTRFNLTGKRLSSVRITPL
jgi:hypothetical protein